MLTPVSIAAIATASVAILLVLVVTMIYIKRRIRRRDTSPRYSTRHPATASSRHFRTARTRPDSRIPNLTPRRLDRRETFTTWGFGYPGAAPSIAPEARYPPIAPSPSTGQTTLVTPTSSSTGKAAKKGWFARTVVADRGEGDTKDHVGDGLVDARSPIVLRPESEEMVVVTYEEGLMKLGLARPHHILYSENSAQTTNSGAGTRGREGAPARLEDIGVRPPISQSSAERTREWAQSPLHRAGTGTFSQPVSAATTQESGVTLPAAANGAERVAAAQAVELSRDARGHQSTWLPSYYHAPGLPLGSEMGAESVLDYRAMAGTGPDSNRWARSRV